MTENLYDYAKQETYTRCEDLKLHTPLNQQYAVQSTLQKGFFTTT